MQADREEAIDVQGNVRDSADDAWKASCWYSFNVSDDPDLLVVVACATMLGETTAASSGSIQLFQGTVRHMPAVRPRDQVMMRQQSGCSASRR